MREESSLRLFPEDPSIEDSYVGQGSIDNVKLTLRKVAKFEMSQTKANELKLKLSI